MSYLERRQKEGEEETGPTAFYLRSGRSSHRLLPRKIVRASLFTPFNFRNICVVKRTRDNHIIKKRRILLAFGESFENIPRC